MYAIHVVTHTCMYTQMYHTYLIVNLRLHKKDDGTSQTEALDVSIELECSLRARDLRIATLESKLRAKKAQLIAQIRDGSRNFHRGSKVAGAHKVCGNFHKLCKF